MAGMGTRTVTEPPEPNPFEESNRWDKVWRLYRFAMDRGHSAETVSRWDDADWQDALDAIQPETLRTMGFPSPVSQGMVIGLMMSAEARARA